MFRQWCLYQCDPYLEKWVINWTEPAEDGVVATTDAMTVGEAWKQFNVSFEVREILRVFHPDWQP